MNACVGGATGARLARRCAAVRPRRTLSIVKDNLYGAKFVDTSRAGWSAPSASSPTPTTAARPGRCSVEDDAAALRRRLRRCAARLDRRQVAAHPAHHRRRGDLGAAEERHPDKHLFNVDCVDANTAWAVGDWGAIMVTHDGGEHWEDRSLDAGRHPLRLSHVRCPRTAGSPARSAPSSPPPTAARPGASRSRGGEDPLRHLLRRRAAGLGGRHRRADPAHRRRRADLEGAERHERECADARAGGLRTALENPASTPSRSIGQLGRRRRARSALILIERGRRPDLGARRRCRTKQSASEWFRAVSLVPGTDGIVVGADGCAARSSTTRSTCRQQSRHGGDAECCRAVIEAYLHFLLRRRVPVAIVVGIAHALLRLVQLRGLTIFTNFFDLYPPRHPYIQVYQKYRKMFGTSNVLLMAVEAKNGDDLRRSRRSSRRSTASPSTCCTKSRA